ncbi:CSF2R factor, partial [Crypturellus soui]|nr:CSF2R factor [Crypturellus soui]
MNCTWSAGRDAPGDTQYFLYWQNSGEEEEKQCELYVKDENGRHIGCEFQNVTVKDDTITYFIVNGSSKDSLIQFYDEYIKLYNIEKFMPPLNITANCDGNQKGCLIHWQQPKISRSGKDDCFKYEVVIKNKVRGFFLSIFNINIPLPRHICNRHLSLLHYLFQNFNSKKRYRVKVRAAGSDFCLVNTGWGEWSAPLDFGENENQFFGLVFRTYFLFTS